MKIASESLRLFAPLFVVAVFAAMSQPAVAASPAMPGGPWQQTCEDASIRSGMLYARCRQDNGQYRSTSALLLDTCQGYSNRNGQLYCEKNGNNSSKSRWSGSYGESCRDISVDKHGRLSATCRKANGSPIAAISRRSNARAIGPATAMASSSANRRATSATAGKGRSRSPAGTFP